MPAAPDVRTRPSDPLAASKRLGIQLGLGAARATCWRALGEPQRRFPAVLVAGTNGKGSTSALLAAMAQAAGYRTGLYTSPHLEVVEERLRIDGRTDRARPLRRPARRTWSISPSGRPELPPTYFEALTLAAFLLVRRGEGRPRRGRGRPRRPARRHQPLRSHPLADHPDRLRPPGVPGRHPRRDRPREGGHPPLRDAGAGLDRGARGGGVGAGRRRRDRRRPPLRLGRGADRGRSSPRAGPASGSGSPRRPAPTICEIALLGAHQATQPRARRAGRRALGELGFDRIGPRGDRGRRRRLPLAGPAGGDRAPRRPPHPPRRRPQRGGRRGRSPSFLDATRAARSTSSSASSPTRTSRRCSASSRPAPERIVLTTPASPRAKDPAELAALLRDIAGEVLVEPDRERGARSGARAGRGGAGGLRVDLPDWGGADAGDSPACPIASLVTGTVCPPRPHPRSLSRGEREGPLMRRYP